jgi:uncharacterized RmlC-like cupin family protein
MTESQHKSVGVQVVRHTQLSAATAQTPGMTRTAAVSPETTGNARLWVGRVFTPPGTVSGWHHHGDCETAIYIVQGRARFSWGPDGGESAEVGPGDFLDVAPGAVHREECLGDEPVVMVVSRACNGVIVVNTDGPESGA